MHSLTTTFLTPIRCYKTSTPATVDLDHETSRQRDRKARTGDSRRLHKGKAHFKNQLRTGGNNLHVKVAVKSWEKPVLSNTQWSARASTHSPEALVHFAAGECPVWSNGEWKLSSTLAAYHCWFGELFEGPKNLTGLDQIWSKVATNSCHHTWRQKKYNR